MVGLGSGSGGSTAAIAAARLGASVLLIEKLPFLGGNSTAVLDRFYGFYALESRSIRVVDGIPGNIVRALEKLGPVIERPNTCGAGTGVTYNADHIKVAGETTATQAGVTVILRAFAQDVHLVEGPVLSVLLATKAGLRQVSASAWVDASGDSDLCHFARFAYELAGTIGAAQTLTTTLSPRLIRHSRTTDSRHATPPRTMMVLR